jgi:hypothetical protein
MKGFKKKLNVKSSESFLNKLKLEKDETRKKILIAAHVSKELSQKGVKLIIVGGSAVEYTPLVNSILEILT